MEMRVQKSTKEVSGGARGAGRPGGAVRPRRLPPSPPRPLSWRT